MTNIIIPNSNTFEFNDLRLMPPSGIQGGAYFTKFEYKNKPLYIQTCKSLTKQGIVKTGKRYYCDLMFDNTNEDIITWFEDFENKCYELMYEKKDRWFQGSLTKEDIENAFTPTLRVYKSGKYYLIRTNIKTNSANDLELKVYDESQSHLGKDALTNNSKIVSILEISGIKFTQHKFQLEIVLKQSMIIKDELIFENCLINTNYNKREINTSSYLEKDTEENDDVDVKNNDYEIENDDVEKNDDVDVKNIDYDVENNDVIEKVDVDVENVDVDVENKDDETIVKMEEKVIDTLEDSLTELDPMTELDFSEMSDISSEPLKIKDANIVYYEMYKKARIEAKEAKKKAQHAYLEAKKIKDLHLLDVSDNDSDSDSDINELSKMY